MINENKFAQYGISRNLTDIDCIVIHNTHRNDMSARELKNWLENECQTSQACHYFVDDKEVVEVMPLDYVAWNTGKSYDRGNMNGIAIEICSNLDHSKYIKGEERAIKLIKKLMKEYNISVDNIFFHNEFLRNSDCPINILQLYKTKENFINKYFRQ